MKKLWSLLICMLAVLCISSNAQTLATLDVSVGGGGTNPVSTQNLFRNFMPVVLPLVNQDTASGWNATTNTYTIPSSGLYTITSTLRLVDGTTTASFAEGVNTAAGDGPWMVWNQFTGKRTTLVNTRSALLTSGQQLQLYGYCDSFAACNIDSAHLVIQQQCTPSSCGGSGPGGGVTLLNTLVGGITLVGNANLSVTPVGQNINLVVSGFDASGAAAAVLSTSAQKASNLSDLASATTARTNLGLGTASTHASTDFDASGAAAAAQAAAIAASDPVGSAATAQSNAVGLSLQKASNLSDLASASTARTNLGLGTAATHANTDFDAAGAAATAQTNAINASLQRASNLSDLANAGTARTNLGLGTAAVQNVGAFAQTANNLSDLASASTARTNLGLGAVALLSSLPVGSSSIPGILQCGSGTTCTAGTITVSASGLTLQNNGVANGSQTLLNIKNGANITITDDGIGGLTFASSGGSQTYPSAGIMVSTGSAFGTSLAAPTGTIVGTTDTQTLTNKTIDGVPPATMAFLDATSSIQTQLNGKQATLTLPLSIANGGTGAATAVANSVYGNFTGSTAAPGFSATPVFSAALLTGFPTFNQNSTGSSATLTTARTIGGNSFNGSANIALVNKFIVQGTTDAGLTGAQFLGALTTGLLCNTTTTGVLSICVAGTAYLTPIGSSAGLSQATTGAFGVVKPDGTSILISSGVISLGAFTGDVSNTGVATTVNKIGGVAVTISPSSGLLACWTSSSVLGNCPMDYNVTNSLAFTSTKKIYAPGFISTSVTDPSQLVYTVNGIAPAVVASSAGWGVNTTLTAAGTYLMPDAPGSGIWLAANATGIVTTSILSEVDGDCVVGVSGVWAAASCPGGGSSAFSSLTSGTNTAMAALVGTGASLGVTGTGTINATSINGNTFPASAGLTSGGVLFGSSTSAVGVSSLLTANVVMLGGGAGAGPGNSLATDNGSSFTYTGTTGIKGTHFISTGSTAGFLFLPQGTTSTGDGNCTTTTICIQAPAAVTSYSITLPGAAATGFPFYTNTSSAIVETIIGTSGSGNVCLVTSCTLITPTLGVATATSLNKVTITAPGTSATLTLITGSSLITAGAFALTLTSTAASNATIPSGTHSLAPLDSPSFTTPTLGVASGTSLALTSFASGATFRATGTTFTVAGCGTATGLTGGATSGQFTGGSATCTPVVTTGLTSTHGYSCWVNDQTTSTAAFRQTANSATTVTFTAQGTVGSTDVINFGCMEY